jgi:hypothetical protein
MTLHSNFAIVRNIKTNDFYVAHGENEYTNLITGVRGFIKEATANKVFVINLEATKMFFEYPLIQELITRTSFFFEKINLDVS